MPEHRHRRPHGTSVFAVGPIVLIAVVATVAFFAWLIIQYLPKLTFNDWNELAALGQVLGAAATAITFILVAVGLLQNQHSIQAQLVELSVQTAAVEQASRSLYSQLFVGHLRYLNDALDRKAETILALIRASADADRLSRLASAVGEKAIAVVDATNFVETVPDDILSSELLVQLAYRDYQNSFEDIRASAAATPETERLFRIALGGSNYERLAIAIERRLGKPSASPLAASESP